MVLYLPLLLLLMILGGLDGGRFNWSYMPLVL